MDQNYFHFFTVKKGAIYSSTYFLELWYVRNQISTLLLLKYSLHLNNQWNRFKGEVKMKHNYWKKLKKLGWCAYGLLENVSNFKEFPLESCPSMKNSWLFRQCVHNYCSQLLQSDYLVFNLKCSYKFICFFSSTLKLAN